MFCHSSTGLTMRQAPSLPSPLRRSARAAKVQAAEKPAGQPKKARPISLCPVVQAAGSL